MQSMAHSPTVPQRLSSPGYRNHATNLKYSKLQVNQVSDVHSGTLQRREKISGILEASTEIESGKSLKQSNPRSFAKNLSINCQNPEDVESKHIQMIGNLNQSMEMQTGSPSSNKVNEISSGLRQKSVGEVDSVDMVTVDNNNIQKTEFTNMKSGNEFEELLLDHLELSSYSSCLNQSNNIEIRFLKKNISQDLEVQAKQSQIRKLDFFQEISRINCKMHKETNNQCKKMEIICLECFKLLCPHCVIFGTGKDQNHKKHKIIPLQQFVENISQMITFCKTQKSCATNKVIDFFPSCPFLQKSESAPLQIAGNLHHKLIEAYKRDANKIKQEVDKMIQKIREHEQYLYSQIKLHYESQSKVQQDSDSTQFNIQTYIRKVGSQVMKAIQQFSLDNLTTTAQDILSLLYSPNEKYSSQSAIQLLSRVLTPSTIAMPCMKVSIKPIDNEIAKSISIRFEDQEKNGRLKTEEDLILQNVSSKGSNPIVSRTSLDLDDNKNHISKARSVDIFTKKEENNKTRNFVSPPRPSNLKFSQANISKKLIQKPSIQLDNTSLQESSTMERLLQSNILDLCNQNLTDQKMLVLLKKHLGVASQRKQIKSLNASFNLLTDEGFTSLLPLLGNMTNLNLSSNLLSDRILDIILKNKDKLVKLRLINIRGNKCKRATVMKSKVESLGKMGIAVCLSD